MNRILLVDNDKAAQLLYADELTEEGFEVITTGDMSELRKLIEKQRPDLVVVDQQMVERNGFDHLRDLRNIYVKSDLKSMAVDIPVDKGSNVQTFKRNIIRAFEIAGQSSCETCHHNLGENDPFMHKIA